jgi:iron complex transport system substrate-binding protein
MILPSSSSARCHSTRKARIVLGRKLGCFAALLAWLPWQAPLSAQQRPDASAVSRPRDQRPTHLITDELGREVKVPDSVRRIVSLAPNLTETVFALGQGDFLVGDTDFCDYPAEAVQKHHIGGPVNPNIEEIVALQPDLVLATKSINRRETVDALDRLGLPVYVSDPHSVDEMVLSTERLGVILHVDHIAETLVEDLRTRLADLDRRIATTTPRRVLFVVWTDPLISVGRDNFLSDALRRAGAKSVIDASAEWPRVSLESAVSLKPDYLVFADARADNAQRQIDSLRVKPGWRELEAVRRGKVIVISDAINRPAPRMVDAIEQLARALHPEAFVARTRESDKAGPTSLEACACAR